MRILKQSTAPIITFLLVSSADHVTGLTGATVTVKLSKNGGSGATATNAVNQVDSVNLPGWYQITLTAGETNTIGDLIIRATATGADQTDRLCVVESADITDMDGEIDAVLTALSAIPTAPLLSSDTRLGNLDAAISSRLPTAGYMAPPATVTLAASQPLYAPAKALDVAITVNPTAVTVNPTLTTEEHTQLMALPMAAAPTVAQIDTALTVAHGSGSWKSGSGGGSTGNGITPVNHDTGGVDALRYLTSTGIPVDNGSIVAYLKSSYDAGNLSAPVGSIMTRSDGRWQNPLLLDHGVTYTLLCYKQGVYQATTVEVTP